MKLPLIIAGFAGIGKTYLSKKYSNVIDLESSRFVYYYSNVDPKDYEKMKGRRDRIPNKDFPNNYIEEIKKSMEKYDVICVWFNERVFPFYDENNIDFAVCIPTAQAFEKYEKRYRERGNNDVWIDGVKNYFEKCSKMFENTTKHKIVLQEDEYLEDWLIKSGYDLKK